MHSCSYGSIQQADAVLGCYLMRHAIRLIPWMDRQSKLVMVNRKDLLGLEVEYDFLKVFRRGMDITPVFVILPVLEKSEVDSAKTLMYLAKALVIASIAAYIDFATDGFHHERCPECLIALAQ